MKPWKQADEFTKLAAAATPLYWAAEKRGWELKAFTLILNKKLSDRLNDGDTTATQYIRDQLTRLIPAGVGADAEFCLEKAPEALADESSRRRWHIHGLITGPVGFAAQGHTSLRRALRSLRGEADTDLMFRTPGEEFELGMRSSAIRWCFYAFKNALTLELNPALAEPYDIPLGKQTHISSHLRREAQRWHDGALAGLIAPELMQDAPIGFYSPE